MRDGYILLHRKGLTSAEWKRPMQTLAWIDFCTMAAYEEFVAPDGVTVCRGEVIASYGFLATRWRKSKGRVHDWIQDWISQGKVERLAERCAERNAERFFIVNYAKYQYGPELLSERLAERKPEPMKRKQLEKKQEKNYVCRSETETLFNSIDELCQKCGVSNNINKKSLDILVERYVGKIKMKVEAHHCLAWLVDKGLRTISASRLGNWFKRAAENQKRDQLRGLEWKEAQINPAMAERRKVGDVAEKARIEESLDHFIASQHE